MEFTKEELKQIKHHSLKESDVLQQLADFQDGFLSSDLVDSARVDNGAIKAYTDKQIEDYIALYDNEKDKYRITKFVPSSGAATRMMKDFYAFLSDYKDELSTPLDSFGSIKNAIQNIRKFAFFPLLKDKMLADGLDIAKCLKNKEYKTIVEYILTDKGLNYGKYPKAWILFHTHNNKPITAFEQHLQEAADYAQSNNEANLVFTITEEHLDGFTKLKDELQPIYEQENKLQYNIDFVFQKHSTDTVAVTLDNQLLKDSNNNIVFRPSGHGALIENLNHIDADIIFIKNIDNISSIYVAETIKYKKLLAGVLISVKKKIDNLIIKLKRADLSKQELVSIGKTISTLLHRKDLLTHMDFPTEAAYRRYLREKLNCPIRVCGMVKNTGEPGGGPFFVRKNNEISLQIVEKTQINLNNKEQKAIFESSTHFNPVDLVCSIKDYNGKKFNLMSYIDKQAGFISEKSYEGKQIKAMEKPGLWNGAMAKWITIFVEVPLQTFTPVKTLTDLLKPVHQ